MVELKDLVNVHKGKKFLVCGCGQSLDQLPLEALTNWPGVTIGVNRILDRFTPDYHLDIHKAEGHITDNLTEIEGIHFEYFNPSTKIDVNKSGRLTMRGTVALTALTLAYQMGASEIYLIGIDLKGEHFEGCESIIGRHHLLEHGHHDELKATVNTFNEAIELYEKAGVKVINLSEDSLIDAGRL